MIERRTEILIPPTLFKSPLRHPRVFFPGPRPVFDSQISNMFG